MRRYEEGSKHNRQRDDNIILRVFAVLILWVRVLLILHEVRRVESPDLRSNNLRAVVRALIMKATAKFHAENLNCITQTAAQSQKVPAGHAQQFTL